MSSSESLDQSGSIVKLSNEDARTEQALAQTEFQDCLTCRIIGTGALAGVGIYALRMSRAGAPGSPVGKRIMGGVGIGFLIGSYFRWTM
ncbi:hypothetical protein DICSQDRAFT_64674 [Dichomitus squalens LYAD-421 SS1]|uniref:Distal membrane-arm assembly complex protein 1-like domain-containing protein n=2 Tax=Dichomitus squalens TaxID=114155 RepID=A0A4Q9PYU2_9APHY|nr:uncharacterized protein DICSQDRAFT_64674 [Dichomitus squalens LYAD-421 SS1]EJF59627.1 hypothetical protein DICSQDRAFT_64674 [Dichomitus squalens LYAD-421 SS1]TBU59760.1 hypothetical protein BD310DRAFT_816564 [Dichomitus squalens]